VAVSEQRGRSGRRRLRFPRPTRNQRIAFWLTGIVVLLGANIWALHRAVAVERARVPYSPFFLQEVRRGNVAQITSKGSAIQGELRHAVTGVGGSHAVRLFATEVPAFANETELARLLQQNGVVINAEPLKQGLVWWKSLLFGFGPTVFLLLLLYWLFKRLGRNQATLGGFSRSRARRFQAQGSTTTFAEVAGIDDAKGELSEIVDFLKSPDKYRRLGARTPRGVLLSGPPGTGKTLLARAVAGEAGVPFFSMSASEFVEAIVGVGASRVRDLFRQAKASAPSIVFIDELDAIGRARSGRAGVGSEEREQTLNQILTEMDGFDALTEVIVVGATNRLDVLDAALLRPGRFDRRVAVRPPDRNGRRLILDVHVTDVLLARDVRLDDIAARTAGMVGADLANLVNEAALQAARLSHERVTADDFSTALEKVLLGAERKVLLTENDRRRTAYHEAGHALVAMLTPGADPVRKVSIVPRGVSLGVTLSRPDADRFNYTRQELDATLRVLLGGRAAERVVFGDATTGAESDLAQLTRIARQMVGRWGMSERVGLLSVLEDDGSYDAASAVETQALVDEEARRLAEEANRDVEALLRAERTRLDALAAALLESETLDELDVYATVGLPSPETAPADVVWTAGES